MAELNEILEKIVGLAEDEAAPKDEAPAAQSGEVIVEGFCLPPYLKEPVKLGAKITKPDDMPIEKWERLFAQKYLKEESA